MARGIPSQNVVLVCNQEEHNGRHLDQAVHELSLSLLSHRGEHLLPAPTAQILIRNRTGLSFTNSEEIGLWNPVKKATQLRPFASTSGTASRARVRSNVSLSIELRRSVHHPACPRASSSTPGRNAASNRAGRLSWSWKRFHGPLECSCPARHWRSVKDDRQTLSYLELPRRSRRAEADLSRRKS